MKHVKILAVLLGAALCIPAFGQSGTALRPRNSTSNVWQSNAADTASAPTIEEQWELILQILPSDYSPASIERLARAFAAVETDRRNDRAVRQYRRDLGNWQRNIWGNGKISPIPIPPFRVEMEVSLGPAGWEWQQVISDEFVMPMFEPGDAFLSRLSAKQLAVIGYAKPASPPAGTIAVGLRLRDGRYVALDTDTVPNGRIIEYDGQQLKKVVWKTPFGQPQWYVVAP